MTIAITGRAATERAPRYLKQLCSHLGEKLDVEFDKSGGTVRYQDVTAQLTPTDTTLEIAISGVEQLNFYRAMGIVAGHLEKFGAKDGLQVDWDDADLAAAYAAKKEEANN
ncbi:DUF2218 domain-containing protein [Demequina aurantiaca]|uniref:DUF2218 domain-containing protein n=1 Tax=Demequina aurantiaca TaxID=676200 RepID=UPI0007815F3B|nr:DUF2218 domain-containing protein [Demequina aurantiaca]